MRNMPPQCRKRRGASIPRARAVADSARIGAISFGTLDGCTNPLGC